MTDTDLRAAMKTLAFDMHRGWKHVGDGADAAALIDKVLAAHPAPDEASDCGEHKRCDGSGPDCWEPDPTPAPESAEAGETFATKLMKRGFEEMTHRVTESSVESSEPSDRALTGPEQQAARSLSEDERKALHARLDSVEADRLAMERERNHAMVRAEKAEALQAYTYKIARAVDDRAERAEAEVASLREELDEHRAHYVDPREHEALREQVAAVEALADECASSACLHLNDLWGRIRAALTDPGETLRARDERVWAEGFRFGLSWRSDAPEPRNPYAKEGESNGE